MVIAVAPSGRGISVALVDEIATKPAKGRWLAANIALGRLHVRQVEIEIKGAQGVRDDPAAERERREAANTLIDAGIANLVSRLRMVGLIVEGRQT